MIREPKPFQVRVIFKDYLRLLHKYNVREATDTFNLSGKGSATYYWNSIERKREYLRRWSHLLTA